MKPIDSSPGNQEQIDDIPDYSPIAVLSRLLAYEKDAIEERLRNEEEKKRTAAWLEE